jgi:murein DD-endopeptidase MepM/ murein hydrolase activator NlpD
MNRRSARRSHPSSTQRQSTDRQSPWPWIVVAAAALLCLWLGIARAPMTLFAQEPAPTPATSHQIYLPLLAGTQPSTARTTYGHGEWPVGRSYTVRADDTLLSVALEMGMDVEEMACLLSPRFSWKDPLVIGDTLVVPETPFACHRVAVGETLADIAEAYTVSAESILAEAWNELSGEVVAGRNLRIPLSLSADLARGKLVLPGGWTHAKPQPVAPGPQPRPAEADSIPADWPYGSGEFAWPVYGWITQGYRVGHSAIDIAAFQGTPVTAADRGVVIRAGWSSVGYGQFVVIDHNIDYITLYAHLSEIYVEEGQIVGKGQLLGRVGSTGNSTGPHLHFEIRDFGARVDPLTLLPR